MVRFLKNSILLNFIDYFIQLMSKSNNHLRITFYPISGKNATRSNSKSKSSNLTLSPKSSKLHTAECPIGSIATGLYNSNPNDSSTTTDAEGSPNVSEMVQTSGNGDSNTTTTMMGKLMHVIRQ